MTAAVILAAGQGRRMKSDLPKVMHPLLGRPMILRVLEMAAGAGMTDSVVVVGHGREMLIPLLEDRGVRWVVQEPQMGTAHAVQCALEVLSCPEIAVLLGDVPQLEPSTVGELMDSRQRENAAVAVLTACPPDISGYGRVIRDTGSRISGIVEERDASPEQLAIGEINTGLMAFDGTLIRSLISKVDNANSQGEYYLTDCVGAAVSIGLSAVAVKAADWTEVAGVNDPGQLASATDRLRTRVIGSHQRCGVLIPDPADVWIEETVSIGQGAVIGKGCRLCGCTVIGRDSVLGEGCVVIDASIPDGAVLADLSIVGREV